MTPAVGTLLVALRTFSVVESLPFDIINVVFVVIVAVIVAVIVSVAVAFVADELDNVDVDDDDVVVDVIELVSPLCVDAVVNDDAH